MASVARTLRADKNLGVFIDNRQDWYAMWIRLVTPGLRSLIPLLRRMCPKESGNMAASAYLVTRGAGTTLGVRIGFRASYATYARGDQVIDAFLRSAAVAVVLARAQRIIFNEIESENRWLTSLEEYAEQFGILWFRSRRIFRHRPVRNQDRNRDRDREQDHRRNRPAVQKFEDWQRQRYGGSNYNSNRALTGYAAKQAIQASERALRQRSAASGLRLLFRVARKAIIKF